MENLYQRKRNRLEGNLYRQPGAYFITICTQNRKNVFWNQLTTKEGEPLPLNQTGRIAESEILKIGQNGISTVRVEKFVVMPNHVHLLFVVESTSEHACPVYVMSFDIINEPSVSASGIPYGKRVFMIGLCETKKSIA